MGLFKIVVIKWEKLQMTLSGCWSRDKLLNQIYNYQNTPQKKHILKLMKKKDNTINSKR